MNNNNSLENRYNDGISTNNDKSYTNVIKPKKYAFGGNVLYFVGPRLTSGRLSDSVESVNDDNVSESCHLSTVLVLLEALVFVCDVDGVAVALAFGAFAGVVESASVGLFLLDVCGPPS